MASPSVLAVYPGTFDPITLGHEDLVRRSIQLFDRVIVAVAAGHHKKTLFSLEERLDMVREVFRPYPQVSVESFTGLMRDFVVARGGKAMIRGLRAVTDFDYEFQLAGMNRALMPDVETVFLTPGDQYLFISSTLVREIATLGGEVEKFVSPPVLARLQKKRPKERRDALCAQRRCGISVRRSPGRWPGRWQACWGRRAQRPVWMRGPVPLLAPPACSRGSRA